MICDLYLWFDLWFAHHWLWVSQPGQLSLPFLLGPSTSSNPWITVLDTIKRQTIYVRLYGRRSKSVGADLDCGLLYSVTAVAVCGVI